jgi:hypothetical protein
MTGKRKGSALGVAGGVLSVILLVLLISTAAGALPYTTVRYEIFHWETDTWVEYDPGDAMPSGGNLPGTNLWKYEYNVINWSAPQPLRQIYTFFNSDNVAMDATWAGDAAPTGWTTAQVGPFDPDFNWKERYMASSSEYYIPAPDSLAGFSVEFTWTGEFIPGSQLYDAVYSGGSESATTVHSGDPTATSSESWGRVKALFR